MRLLVVNGAYLPAQKYGGPVVSLVNFVENLGDDYDIDIVCKNHDLHENQPFQNIREGFQPVGKARVCYLPDAELNKKTFRRILEERKPDCLYLSSIFSAKMNVPLLSLAKKLQIPVVYAPRGELNPAVLQMKSWKKRLFLFAMRRSGLYRNVVFQASSSAERETIIKALKVGPANVLVAPNLPSAPKAAERQPKEQGKLRIVFLARIHRSKNLAYAIERVLALQGSVSFDIYGPVEHEDYWQECCRLMQHAPKNIQFNYCGLAPVGSAGEIFGKYDCFLFPTLSENYGQVIAEAVQAGTLPVISKGTTPWDDLQGGEVLPLSEPERFSSALQELCDMDEQAYEVRRARLLQYAEIKINKQELIACTKTLFQTALGGKTL